MSILSGTPWPRRLGVTAAVLGALAPFAGSPYAARHGRLDVKALARAVEREDDHVTAVELARWVKERRANLRIVDVRPAAEYDLYHVPTAERISLGALVNTRFDDAETIVLYSEGGAHAAQAWVLLRALGITKVYFLRGGLNEWLDEVMTPTLSADATDAERAEFDRVAELSRYFGGVPQRGERAAVSADHQPVARASPPGASRAASAVQRVRKRGC